MRVGVLGCGYWGSKHVRILHELDGVEQVVAIDPREERLAALARSFPRLRCFKDLDHALDADVVDALVIATPPRSHAAVAEKAIACGVHVLVEKPFTMSTADADRVIAAAHAASVTLMVGHTFEFNPAVQALRDTMVVQRDLGEICYIDTARLNLGLYQTDCNVFWDLAPHDISICNYLLGSTPTKVDAWALRNAHAGIEDVGYLRLEYEDVNVTANVHVSWLDPCKVRRVTVVGTEKMAVYNDLNDEERLRVYDKGVVTGAVDERQHGVPASYRYGSIVAPYIDFREPLMLQDSHFVHCARQRLQPAANGISGRAVVAVLEAVTSSLASEGPVLLDPVTTRGTPLMSKAAV